MTSAFAAGFFYFVISTALLWWFARVLLRSRGSATPVAGGTKWALLFFLPAKLTFVLGSLYFCLVRLKLAPWEFTIGAGSGLVLFTATALLFRYLPAKK